MAERRESVVLDFSVDEQDSIESIQSLTKANKELREERNKLNISTEQGKKRAQEINAVIDQNTGKIKANVSAIEQQKINIGNYKSALDGVHPALGKVGQGLEAGSAGFKAMARSALAFIATPIGAILAGLVVVFTLLKTALSQNDDLMDKFENITNAVGVAVQVVTSRIGKMGEALLAFVTLDFKKGIDLTAQAFGGLAEEIGNAVRQQQLFLDASRDLEDAERRLRIETEKQGLQIAKLIKESKNRNLSLDESSAKLQEAAKKEEDLQRVREDLAVRNLVITARQLRADKEFQQQSNENFDQYVERLLNSSKLSGEEKNKLADAVIKVEQARNSSLVLQQKIENDLSAIQDKRAAAIEKQNAALEKQSELERQARIAQREREIGTAAKDDFDTEIELSKNLVSNLNKSLAERQKMYDEYYKKKGEDAKKAADLEIMLEDQKLAAAAGVAAGIAGLLDEQSAAYKAFASAQVIISTYSAATKAYEAAFLPIPTVASPALGIAFAAAAVLQGVANLAKINGVEFWSGGYTGPGGKYDYAGNVHKGEVVWNQEDVKAVGGPAAANAMRPTAGFRSSIGPGYFDGGFVSNSIASPINSQLELLNIVKNLPAPEVSVKEVSKFQKRVKIKEQFSKR